MTVPRLLGLGSGPVSLTLVRHGESAGNVEDARASASGAETLDLDARDADVELSERGEQQANALRDWMADAREDDRPTLVVASPYRRALETARLAVGSTGVELVVDERLRERDLGVFDGLTGRGIRARYPEEADRRSRLGKFYYQPPSGESWADVVLRVRSLLGDLRHGFDDARVWLFTHQAVIMAFRYVLEGLDEEHLLEQAKEHPLANASLTTYARRDGGLVLDAVGDSSIVDASTEVTHEETRSSAAVDSHV
jgi:broad specificity phosphatase PhoE